MVEVSSNRRTQFEGLYLLGFFYDIVGLTRDFQTVGYVHVGNEVFIRAGAH
jgi:hypothetical protein